MDLATGVTLYLLGDVLFRQVTGLGRSTLRLLFAALALLSGLIGLGGLLHLALLVLLLVAMLALEGRRV